MKTVSSRDANQHFSKLLAEAEQGRETVITKRGVPVAKLVPFTARKMTKERKAAVEQLKHAAYFHRQVVWLQDRFPKAELEAVPGLVKLVNRKEIEAEIRGKPPDFRREQRRTRARPLLKDMHAWLTNLLARVSAKSEIAQAIGYSLLRWTALTRYVDDGRIEIDNSAAERALRGVALGRNNYLFMGSDAGGERAAAMYSLVETAKLNGLDPQAYLREVFARIAGHPINRIEELLPWNISATSEVHKRAA